MGVIATGRGNPIRGDGGDAFTSWLANRRRSTTAPISSAESRISPGSRSPPASSRLPMRSTATSTPTTRGRRFSTGTPTRWRCRRQVRTIRT